MVSIIFGPFVCVCVGGVCMCVLCVCACVDDNICQYVHI